MKSQHKLYFCLIGGASAFLVSAVSMILLLINPGWQGQAARLTIYAMSATKTAAPSLTPSVDEGQSLDPMGDGHLVNLSSSGAPSMQDLTVAATGASRQYYFAEGYTGKGTVEQLALTNLAAAHATITVTYYYPNALARVRTYPLAALTHKTLNINQEAGANQSVSMFVQSDQLFIAERIMSTQKNGFEAVTRSQGVAAPANSWYFAEGNTTAGWNTLLSVLNPGQQQATLTVHYLPGPGNTSTPAARDTNVYTLPSASRSTIVLNDDRPNQQFGMAITASANVVVERAEYLVHSPWSGGSAFPGITALQKTWYFATGKTADDSTEILVLSNPAPKAAHAHIRYLVTDGSTLTQDVSVPEKSRIEVRVNDLVKDAVHATEITADRAIVAERQDFFMKEMFEPQGTSSTIMGSSEAETAWYAPQVCSDKDMLAGLVLANMSAAAVQVHIILYHATGAPLAANYNLAPHQYVMVTEASIITANEEVGLVITASSPIIVEHHWQ
ncbi:hypothetical protein KSF_022590 [Reticulibacter mediterranei]|uniref:Uncharacterized protein n=1 Tax=Reticulibacter mediterranei TaxID=2778369 RepID=A0A8J3IML8_9CHLR|nr:hypothetical protein [Reticulibacter mediterranei]GHO92211.1 hypothetical protein KSF_022590 [Reticulibacter mediterranei]